MCSYGNMLSNNSMHNYCMIFSYIVTIVKVTFNISCLHATHYNIETQQLIISCHLSLCLLVYLIHVFINVFICSLMYYNLCLSVCVSVSIPIGMYLVGMCAFVLVRMCWCAY